MAEADRDDLISIIDEEDKTTEIPTTLPLLPVRDVVIFTDMLLPLFVGREKSVRAVEEAVGGPGFVFLATQKDAAIENPSTDEIYHTGTVGRVLRILKLPDGRVKVLVQGVAKGTISKFMRKRAPYRVKIDLLPEPPVEEKVTLEVEALMRNVREQSEKILALRGELTNDVTSILQNVDDPGKLADLVASNLRLKIEESQALLEILDPVERLKRVNDVLSRELELSAMQAKIQSEVKDEISKSQRDYYLREQVRAIYKELGEHDDRSIEIEEYEKKIKKAKMPKEANTEALKQLKRLDQMHPDSAESTVIRSYLDWLVELPWSKSTQDVIDIRKARELLDREHYGLTSVKDRILEDLAGQGHRLRRSAQVRAHFPGGHPRRGRDPRAPPHLHRLPSRAHPPEHETERRQQPGLHDGRNRQTRFGFPGRSLFGLAGGPRPGAECRVQRPLSEFALRSVPGDVHPDSQHHRHHSHGAA
jgi:ATP-dependent Lon protease